MCLQRKRRESDKLWTNGNGIVPVESSYWLRRTALIAAPVALLLMHALLAEADPRKFFGFDSTRIWPIWLRWTWLGLGILAAISDTVRSRLTRAAIATRLMTGRVPPILRWIGIVAVTVALLVGLRCQNFFLGDSYHLIRAIPRGLMVHWNEPLDILLHALVFRGLAVFLEMSSAEWSYVVVSGAAGLVYVFLPSRMARELELEGSAKALFVGMMLTCGSIQLFFGYAESYTLVSLLSLLSLTAGLRSLRLGTGAGGAAFLGGLAVCFHPLAFTLGPALLLLAWGSMRRLALAAVCYVLPIGLLILGMTIGGHGLSMLGTVDKPGGGDNSMLVPLWETDARYERTTLFAPRHFWEVFNTVCLSSPLALPMIAFGLGFARKGRRRGAVTTDAETKGQRRAEVAAESGLPGPSSAGEGATESGWRIGAGGFLAAAAAGMGLFVALWNPDLGAAGDWDLFAAAGFVFTVYGAYLMCHALDEEELRLAAVLYPLSSFLVTAPWILGNSVRAIPPRPGAALGGQ